MATSGSYNFLPSVADFVTQAYRRNHIFPPSLTIEHLSSARFEANILLTDWSANRGVNLAQVDQINIPLIPGVAFFDVPKETVDLLDVYLRTFQPGTTTTTIGNALTPVVVIPGQPTVSNLGEPAVMAPGSGVFSVTSGSQHVTMNWPAHGLNPGDPIFFQYPVTAGPLTLPNFVIVNTVPDSDTLTFLAATPSPATRTDVGGTPLFTTQTGSATVTVVQPDHGYSIGDTITVSPDVTVGGITLSGSYTVVTVPESWEFTFAAADQATSIESVFLNDGQIEMAVQDPTLSPYTDVPLFPLSRTDYAMIPYKNSQGRPTSFWYDRLQQPNLTLYPLAPSGSYYGFMAYRMRQIQDAVPADGQTLDTPPRFWSAFLAALTAALAETWNPVEWQAKVQAAESAWDRAAAADQERVSTYISPQVQNYYR